MKGFRVLAAVLLAAVLQTQTANASLLLEPYLGYATGSSEQDVTLLGTTATGKADVSGVLYGARLGYGFGPIIAAADVTMGSQKSKPESGGTSADGDASIMGVTVMFAPPVIPVRAWAGYAFKNEMKFDDSKYEGTAIKVGGGFSPIPLLPLSVNLEYVMSTFDKLTANGSSATLPASFGALGTLDKLKANVVFLSVSAPLSF